MEKRSATTSDRPAMPFLSMCGWDILLGSQNYNSLLRAYRKDIHSVTGTKASVDHYSQLQETETRRFLLHVARAPEKTSEHMRASISAMILHLNYGYSIIGNDTDPLVALAEDALAEFADAIVPGEWAVDVFPALRFLPKWMPGPDFHAVAEKYRRITLETVVGHLPSRKKQYVANNLSPSLAADLLEKGSQEMTPGREERIKWSLASICLGGVDTVSPFPAVRLCRPTNSVAASNGTRVVFA